MNQPIRVDVDRLLSTCGGSTHRAAIMIDAFITDYERERQALSTAFEAQDMDAIRKDIHTLRGLTSNVGAMKLNALLELGSEFKTSLESLTQIFQQVDQEYARVKEELESLELSD